MFPGVFGVFVAKRARFELGQDAQAVDGPLFELFERNVGGGRYGVKVEPVRVCRVRKDWLSELLCAVVEVRAPLCVDAVDI